MKKLCGVLSLNFKLLQTTMRCVFIFSPRDSSKRGTIGIDTHPGTVLYLQTTCHTSNLLTQDQYTLIPSLMLPHFRFRSPSLNLCVTDYLEDSTLASFPGLCVGTSLANFFFGPTSNLNFQKHELCACANKL